MPKPSLAETELSILRASVRLAEAGRPDDVFDYAFSELANHRWSNEEHRIVFESLRAAIRRHQSTSLRQEMAAEATRMGHPDVDWNLYFQAPNDVTPLADLLHTLRK
jgi:hypothetical protein